jgi:hypothetical protein
MNIVQSIESAREEKVGSHGIGADVLKTALTRAESALVWIRARHADRALPLLRLPETHADLEVIRNTARQLADAACGVRRSGRRRVSPAASTALHRQS